MNRLIGALCFLAFAAGCKKENTSVENPAAVFSEREKIIITDKSLTTLTDTVTFRQDSIYRYQIGTGDNIVFLHTSYYNDYTGLGIQGEQKIIFQVPGATMSFVLQDSLALSRAKVLVTSTCGECFGGIRFLTNGYIKGTRLNATVWLMEAMLSSPRFPAAVFSFNQQFRQE